MEEAPVLKPMELKHSDVCRLGHVLSKFVCMAQRPPRRDPRRPVVVSVRQKHAGFLVRVHACIQVEMRAVLGCIAEILRLSKKLCGQGDEHSGGEPILDQLELRRSYERIDDRHNGRSDEHPGGGSTKGLEVHLGLEQPYVAKKKYAALRFADDLRGPGFPYRANRC